MSRLPTLVILLFSLWSARALAEDSLVENAAVRNRLYPSQGHLEVSGVAGFLAMPQLVRTVNLNLGLAYAFTETFAVEVRGGYAISGLTGLAQSVRDNLMLRDPNNNQDAIVDDLTGLWQLKANAALGLRWAPIYGKVNLVADLPVHFNFYLWAGPGFAALERESIVYCQQASADRTCAAPRVDHANRLMGSAAVGMRFFTHRGGAIRLELRDTFFADSFLIDVDRRVAEQGGQTGAPASSPGLIHAVTADVGYTFIF